MKDIQYKDFSLRTHKKNWRLNRPNLCQFELTFDCDFHCLYCYSDCYNHPKYLKNELSTNKVKEILDKVYDAGCFWLCLSGGDPLKRKDFLEIYAYAKQKGFIVTIFTNGYSLTKEIADFFKDRPPFVVEITLNAINKKTFEEITQVLGTYEKTLEGIKMLIEGNIPLKIKTMKLKNNLKELPKIEDFVKSLGLGFRPSAFIHARLNKDTFPCSLRINPKEHIKINPVRNGVSRRDISNGVNNDNALDCVDERDEDFLCNQSQDTESLRQDISLFRCAAGSPDGIYIDPYGKALFCPCLRQFSVDFLEQEIQNIFKLFSQIRTGHFKKDSPCRSCQIRDKCYSCAGYANLDRDDMQLPSEWFCELAHLVAGYRLQATSHRLQDTNSRR